MSAVSASARPAPDVDAQPRRRGSIPTLPDEVEPRRLRRARVLRRLFVSALALFLLVALSSFLGVRQRSTSAAAEGWSLDLTYPAITRAGLAVPLSWEIRHEGGFPEDGKVVMRMTDGYFDLFDENGFDPQPSSEWSDGTYIYWEFDAPPQGDVMRVGSDTRTGSSVQLTRKKGEASIMVDDEPVLTVAIQTWVMP